MTRPAGDHGRDGREGVGPPMTEAVLYSDTRWIIQYRDRSGLSAPTWRDHAQASSAEAVRAALTEFREADPGREWHAVRREVREVAEPW